MRLTLVALVAAGLTSCATVTPVRAVADTDCAVMASGATWAQSHPAFNNPRFRDLAPSYAFVGGDETPDDWSEAVLDPGAAPLDLRRCPQFRAPPLAGRLVGTTFYQRSSMKGGLAPRAEDFGRLWISRPVYDKDRRRGFLSVGYGCNLWAVTLTRQADGRWDAQGGDPWFLCIA